MCWNDVKIVLNASSDYLLMTFNLSSFAIILMRKRELVALLSLSSWFLVIVIVVALPQGVMGWSAVCDCGIS